MKPSLNDQINEVAQSNVVLALFITALGYVSAYVYNAGYLSSFDVPYMFINISVTSLVVSIGLVALAFMLIVSGIIYFIDLNKTLKKRWTRYFVRAGFLIIIIALLMISFGFLRWKIIAVCLVGLLIGLALRLFMNMVAERSFARGWKSFTRNTFSVDVDTYSVFDKFPSRVMTYVALTVICVGISFGVGGFIANSSSSFPMVKSEGDIKTLIVIKNDDEIITKDYNSSDKTFLPGYSLLKADSLNGVSNFKKSESNDQITRWLESR